MNSAILSPCQLYRYRLDRDVQAEGIVVAFFGVNGSTASAEVDDQTTKKWKVFTQRLGGRKYIAGNVFGFRAVDVKKLAAVSDPMGPDNVRRLDSMMWMESITPYETTFYPLMLHRRGQKKLSERVAQVHMDEALDWAIEACGKVVGR